MKTTQILIVELLLGAAVLSSCSNQVQQKLPGQPQTAIQPPFKGIDVEAEVYTIEASKKSVIETPEGTIITVPESCLVDQNGQKIKGKVAVTYRAIDKPSEIMISGIPMTYDSAGVQNDFISAGMFEIQASQNNKEVFIEKGKSIAVEFGSYTPGDDFNFYKIDEKSGDWTYQGTNKSTVNLKKEEKLKNFLDDNFLEFDIDYSVHDELKDFDGLKWLCVDENDAVNPTKNKDLLDENWWDIELKTLDEKNGIYLVKLSNSERSVSFKVTPYVLEGETADIAGMNSKIAQLNETVAAKKEEEKSIQLQADIIRSFNIPSFGTYNWDKIQKEVAGGDLFVTNASFKVDSKMVNEERKVFHFSGDSKLLSREASSWNQLLFRPKEKNYLLMIMPGNYVAVSSTKDFNSAQSNSNQVFEMTTRKVKINSVEDLDKLLASL